MKLKSVKDTILQSLPGELAGNMLPFWTQDTEGKSGFDLLAADFINRYQNELHREKDAVEQGLSADRQSLGTIQQALDCLQTPNWRPVLAKDAEANGKIIEDLLKEREEYEQYLNQILNQAKTIKVKTDNQVLTDVCEVIDILATYYITTTTSTIRRFRAQQAALINVSALDDKTVAEKIGAKHKLLLSKLSYMEKSISDRESTLLAINELLVKTKLAQDLSVLK